MKKNLLLLIFSLFLKAQFFTQNKGILKIVEPLNKRLVFNGVSDYKKNITIESNQNWEVKSTNPNIEVISEMAGNYTFDVQIRFPNFQTIKVYDTLYFLAQNSQDKDTLIIEQMPVPFLKNYNHKAALTNLKYDAFLEWYKVYSGSGIDDIYKILPDYSNGYILFGWSESLDLFPNIKGITDWTVSGINNLGIPQWAYSIGGKNYDIGIDMILTSDHKFVSIGFAYSNDNDFPVNRNQKDMWVIKFNDIAKNDILWKTHIGGNKNDDIHRIIETKDNNYMLISTSSSNDFDFSNNTAGAVTSIWVFLLSGVDGHIIWSKRYGGSRDDIGSSICALRDENYMIGGSILSSNFFTGNRYGNYDIWTCTINPNGDLLNQSIWGGSSKEELYLHSQDKDNNILLSASSNSTNGTVNATLSSIDNNIYLQKIDANHNPISKRIIEGNLDESFPLVRHYPSNETMVAFESKSKDYDFNENKGDYDMWAFKLNPDLSTKWKFRFGGDSSEFVHNFLTTPSGGVFLSGHTSSPEYMTNQNPNNTRDALLVKLDEAYLSINPKKITITNYSRDTVVVLSRNSSYNIKSTNPNSNLAFNKLFIDSKATSYTEVFLKDFIEEDRIDTVIFSVANTQLRDTLIVIQLPTEFIRINPKLITVEPPLGSKTKFEVRSNSDWTLTSVNKAKFVLSDTKGPFNKNLLIEALEENKSRKYYYDTLIATLTNKTRSDTAYVQQLFADYFEYTPTMAHYLPYKNEKKDFSIETNLEWDVKTLPEWLNYSFEHLFDDKYTLTVVTNINNFKNKKEGNLFFNCKICAEKNILLAQEFIQIKYNSYLEDKIRIKADYTLPKGIYAILYDFTGGIVEKIDLSDEIDKSIDVSYLASGYYVIAIFSETGEKIIAEKIVKN